LEGSQHLLDLRHRAQENPSSRYHLCSAPLWGRASKAAWIPAAKRKGPKGSPCCTPRVDQMTFRPTSRGAGWNACRTHGIMEGHSRWMASRMAGRAMELRRFASPPAAGATPCSRAGHPPGLALPWPRPRRGSPSRRPFGAGQGRRRRSVPGRSPVATLLQVSAGRGDQGQQGLQEARLCRTVGRVEAVQQVLGPQA